MVFSLSTVCGEHSLGGCKGRGRCMYLIYIQVVYLSL
jgi:hypothetical protein